MTSVKCPNCSAAMKISRGTPSKPVEYLCLNCGQKKAVQADSKSMHSSDELSFSNPSNYEPQAEKTEIYIPPQATKPKVEPEPKEEPEPEPEPKSEPAEEEPVEATPVSKKKISTGSRMKKNMEPAKRLTELRKVSKELIGRVNDLEIQFNRRLEDLQKTAVELERIVSSYHE